MFSFNKKSNLKRIIWVILEITRVNKLGKVEDQNRLYRQVQVAALEIQELILLRVSQILRIFETLITNIYNL